MTRAWPAGAAAVLLAACATAPVPSSTAAPVPSEQIRDVSFTTASDTKGTVVITRDQGAMGSVCTMQVYVGETHVADLERVQRLTLYLEPGEHIIGPRHPKGICGAAGVAQELVLSEPGKVTKLRAGYTPDTVQLEHSAY